MADETENNEEVEAVAPADETPEAEVPEAAADESAEAAAEEATPEAAAEEAPAAAGPAQLTPKERKAAARARRGKRRISDPEERAQARKDKAAARTRYRANARARAKAKQAEAPAVVTPPKEHGPGRAKVRQGTVVSDKADKTITVRIDVARRHRRYEKIVRSSSTLHAHDESNEAHIGDRVTIVECRPMSRLKRWKLVEVLERAK